MTEQKNKLSKKHLILMILGCVFPIGIIFILFTIGIPLNKILLFALILICPLSHIFMMKFMMNHGDDTHITHTPESVKDVKDIQERY